jgi:hypothetical protein
MEGGKEESKEQKLRVLNEELKPEGEAATPEKTDTKPAAPQQ